MSASSWLSLLAICILGAISPGPSLAAVMKSTLQGSRNHGLITAIAHAAGIGIYAFLVAAGIAVVITQTPWLFKLMTWSGAAYLAWLGYKSIRSSGSFIGEVSETNSTLSRRQAALDGFLISFLNPKIAVFFLALFSQFVTPETTLTTQLLMALMATLCDGLWYCLIAGVAGHSSILPALRKRATLVSRLCGGLLILVALRILMM
ncbi:LysE family translocator [Endozoicomonas arenosclerae]|uniref:LysE family translocator n=1 Tax=Endozoicomonas arenosclerae TaxID=1633495 RepID=UPI000783FB89|nr:LysE family translocator [Endozoicomonas arenosclerae]